MDLKAFYEDDARRRHSEELEFGHSWNEDGQAFSIGWIAATGELYATRLQVGAFMPTFNGAGPTPTWTPLRSLQVEVLGIVVDAKTISSVMSGWQEAMTRADGVAWVRGRLAHVAEERADPPAEPSRRYDAY
jgi:hypothetical protein